MLHNCSKKKQRATNDEEDEKTNERATKRTNTNERADERDERAQRRKTKKMENEKIGNLEFKKNLKRKLKLTQVVRKSTRK